MEINSYLYQVLLYDFIPLYHSVLFLLISDVI